MKRMTMLEMTRDGEIIERFPANDSEGVLDETLLNLLYPEIKVALVSLPLGSLDLCEQSNFAGKMTQIEHNGVRYRLAGGSGSVKKRKYYFVDEEHCEHILARFDHWPEAAITYFGILVSSCKRIFRENGVNVMVVPDLMLGTNDCRGWFSKRLFLRFDLTPRRFYQFRLAFADMQAKGAFKVMDDEVADHLGADIILPQSSIKPGPTTPVPENGLLYGTEVVPGVREVSRLLSFEGSYTLIVHAPRESVENEIIPEARVRIGQLNAAFSARNHKALVELLGRKVSDDLDEKDETPERTVEAVLLADGSGELTRHPYIYQQLNKMLARWGYKTLTGGGLELPAFALADDGYLFLDNGRLCTGADWLPLDTAITSVSSPYGLCVRHPIRLEEDLLPMIHLHADQVAAELVKREQIDSVEAERIAREQLCLQGVYVLNSQTAKRNGGDFDFDYVCVVDGDKYPRFVAARFNLNERPAITKDKQEKARSPLFNFEHVAVEAGTNQIGYITDLKTSAKAAGCIEEEYELAAQLQDEIDSLKWGKHCDPEVIRRIAQKVELASWLNLKHVDRISDFPAKLEVPPTDPVGAVYNALRPDLSSMLHEPLPIKFFKGLITGSTPDRAKFKEARFMNGLYGAAHQAWSGRIEKTRVRLLQVEAAYNAVKAETDQELNRLRSQDKPTRPKAGEKAASREMQPKLWEKRDLAYERLKEARDKHNDAVQHYKEHAARIAKIIRDWGNGKTEDRRAWAEAVHQAVCRGKGMGSILFLAFPQEAVDMIAERTRGTRSEVLQPKNMGTVVVDGDRLYSVNEDGRRKFVLRYETHTQTVHWRNK